MRLQLALGVAAMTCSLASASTFDIAFTPDLFTPTFRGDANTTWVGWDVFDDNGAGDMIINDVTPDVGSSGGAFVTVDGQDKLSGSLNYYSGFFPVNEQITFDTDGVAGSGFTTIVIQAKTLFGGFGAPVTFSPINGVAPTIVNTATSPLANFTTNAVGEGQFFAKYELPGIDGPQTISMSGGTFTSIDTFVIDSVWSPTGFAPDTAVITPEPGAALLAAFAAAASTVARRRR